MSNRWLFLAELCVQDIKLHVRNKITHLLPWIKIFFGQLWCDLPMIFTRDFVTRENYSQIPSLVTKKSLFTVTHALFIISFMLTKWHYWKWSIRSAKNWWPLNWVFTHMPFWCNKALVIFLSLLPAMIYHLSLTTLPKLMAIFGHMEQTFSGDMNIFSSICISWLAKSIETKGWNKFCIHTWTVAFISLPMVLTKRINHNTYPLSTNWHQLCWFPDRLTL